MDHKEEDERMREKEEGMNKELEREVEERMERGREQGKATILW